MTVWKYHVKNTWKIKKCYNSLANCKERDVKLRVQAEASSETAQLFSENVTYTNNARKLGQKLGSRSALP